MSETISATLPLTRWRGEKAVYHLVIFAGADADVFAGLALMRRLELGHTRGFGSLKVMACVGSTTWRTSVFPQKKQSEWILLISKKVMRAEGLVPGDPIEVEVTPV